MFKFITFLAILSVAYAGVLEATAPVAVAQPVFAKHVEEYDPHPRYHFAYEVQDALTGDSKSQVESRDGDVVQGQYWLVDADGYKRIVDYSADAINGFNAVVRREPLGIVSGHSVAPSVVKSGPIAFAADPALRTSPLTYSSVSPALIQSAPVASYASGPAYVQSAPYAVNAAPAVYAQTAHTAPSAYVAPATYAQSAYSTPVTYGSHRLVNSAPAAIVAHNSYASPAVLKPSSIASYADAGSSLYSNFQATPLASPAILKTTYTSPYSSYAH